jgi:hypothetical protein
MSSVISDYVLLIGLLEDPGNYYRCESVPRAVPVRVTYSPPVLQRGLDAGLLAAAERESQSGAAGDSVMSDDGVIRS